jgi:thiamine-phosphate pyrophosphorylase
LKVAKSTMLLYAVTDRTWLGNSTLAEQVEQAIRGGATLVQLREKHLDFKAFLEQAEELKKVTDRYRIPLIINDNIEVALACDADGVHVGQDDMAAGAVRARIGENKILGVSAETVEQAVQAEKNGADYLGVGAMFPTFTKLDTEPVTFDTLKAICSAVTIPVVAIGGINEQNIIQLKGSGIAGVAVVSAIFAQPDIMAAASRLAVLTRKAVE